MSKNIRFFFFRFSTILVTCNITFLKSVIFLSPRQFPYVYVCRVPTVFNLRIKMTTSVQGWLIRVNRLPRIRSVLRAILFSTYGFVKTRNDCDQFEMSSIVLCKRCGEDRFFDYTLDPPVSNHLKTAKTNTGSISDLYSRSEFQGKHTRWWR